MNSPFGRRRVTRRTWTFHDPTASSYGIDPSSLPGLESTRTTYTPVRSTAELATWWVTEWACARTSIRRGPRFARAYKNERRLVNKKSYGLTCEALWPGTPLQTAAALSPWRKSVSHHCVCMQLSVCFQGISYQSCFSVQLTMAVQDDQPCSSSMVNVCLEEREPC